MSAVLFMWFDHEVWAQVLALLSIPALIILNALFVAAEFSLVAVRKTRIEELVQQGVRGARAVQNATSALDRSIAATQLGITLASLGLGWLGEPAFVELLSPLFKMVPFLDSRIALHSVATGLAFLLITFLHVVFGEFIPKSLALHTPDRISLWVAQPLLVFETHTSADCDYSRNGQLILGLLVLIRCMASRRCIGRGTLLWIEDTEEAGLLDPSRLSSPRTCSTQSMLSIAWPREKMAALEVTTLPRDSGRGAPNCPHSHASL